jgi:hypothetical protein
MANEIQFRSSIIIRKLLSGNAYFDYRSNPTAFNADLITVNPNGPTPGAIPVTTSGVNVDLSKLTALGGWCFIQNLDTTGNVFVEYGIYDTLTFRFYPLGELLTGEYTIIRLSRYIQQELGTGTGTGSLAATAKLRLKSHGGSVIARVDAFDK